MSNAPLTLSVLNDIAYINLRGDPADAAFLDPIKLATGTSLPLTPNTIAIGDNSIYWLGPDEWLLVVPVEQSDATKSALGEALQGQHTAVNDLSGGQITLRISGEKAAELLSKGCSLDLHPSVFSPGTCAQSGLAKAAVIISRHPTEPSFDLVVRRSFSDYLLQWLRRAGAEYGIELV